MGPVRSSQAPAAAQAFARRGAKVGINGRKEPAGLDATTLLPQAVARGVAYVPGAAFHAGQADPRTLRLSFVTASEEQIRSGIAALAAAVREALPRPAAVPVASPMTPGVTA